MTKTNLTKRNKRLLLIGAVLIIMGWVLPVILRHMKSIPVVDEEVAREKTTRGKEDTSIKAAREYMETLRLASAEEVGEILDIKPAPIRGFEIINVAGNEQKKTIDTRIFVANSYLDKTLHLGRINDLWEVGRIVGPSVLTYENYGVTVTHDSSWEGFSLGDSDTGLAEWVLKKSSDEEGGQILFFAEPLGGEFSKAFRNCDAEGITSCKTEIVGQSSFDTAVYVDQMKAYVLEGPEFNLVVMTLLGNSREGNEDERDILSSIRFVKN